MIFNNIIDNNMDNIDDVTEDLDIFVIDNVTEDLDIFVSDLINNIIDNVMEDLIIYDIIDILIYKTIHNFFC